MKAERLMMALAVGGFVALAVPASAIDSATVGSEDTLLAETDLGNSGEDTEEAWVESILGFDVEFTDKDEDGENTWELVDGTDDTYAHLFGGGAEPDYFLVKTGNITDDGNTHFLFSNLDSALYAVIELSDLGITTAGIQGISHVSEFGGGSVPEPNTILLMGAALAGLAAYTRKRG